MWAMGVGEVETILSVLLFRNPCAMLPAAEVQRTLDEPLMSEELRTPPWLATSLELAMDEYDRGAVASCTPSFAPSLALEEASSRFP